MSTRTQHLRSLLNKGLLFVWTAHHDHEFIDLKNALVSPDVMLYHSNWNAPFEVHTDASQLGCGTMLGQKFQGNLRPVKYASKSFSPTESCWPTAHQELFPVKWGLEQFRPYILGHQLKVVTDYANLKWLTSVSPKQAKLARWCMSMAEYDFQIEHRPGKMLHLAYTVKSIKRNGRNTYNQQCMHTRLPLFLDLPVSPHFSWCLVGTLFPQVHVPNFGGGRGVAGSEDFACATLSTTPP